MYRLNNLAPQIGGAQPQQAPAPAPFQAPKFVDGRTLAPQNPLGKYIGEAGAIAGNALTANARHADKMKLKEEEMELRRASADLAQAKFDYERDPANSTNRLNAAKAKQAEAATKVQTAKAKMYNELIDMQGGGAAAQGGGAVGGQAGDPGVVGQAPGGPGAPGQTGQTRGIQSDPNFEQMKKEVLFHDILGNKVVAKMIADRAKADREFGRTMEEARLKELGKDTQEQAQTMYKTYRKAQHREQLYHTFEQLNESNVTGRLSEYNVYFGQVAQSVGLKAQYDSILGNDTTAVQKLEVMQAIQNKLALQLIGAAGKDGETGEGGMPASNLSNRDMEIVRATVPRILNTPGGNKFLIKIGKITAQRAQARAMYFNKWAQDPANRGKSMLSFEDAWNKEKEKFKMDDKFLEELQNFAANAEAKRNKAAKRTKYNSRAASGTPAAIKSGSREVTDSGSTVVYD